VPRLHTAAATNSRVTATPSAFVHLRTDTEYSVVDGMLRIDDLVAAAAADGQPALANTDLSNLLGTVVGLGRPNNTTSLLLFQ